MDGVTVDGKIVDLNVVSNSLHIRGVVGAIVSQHLGAWLTVET